MKYLLLLLSLVFSSAWAQDENPNAAKDVQQFEEWLANNGYKGNAQDNIVNNQVSSGSNTNATPTQSAQSQRPLTYQENQQVMLNSVPAIPAATPEATTAFNNLLKQNMPLTPRQVVQLHQQLDLTQRAAVVPANIPPKPVSSTIMVNLAPGTTPPAVRLSQGYVTALVFVDSTGTPWPISAFDIGNPKAIKIQWDGKSNIILIQAISPYSDGDIVVRLVGLATPITLQLVAGQRVVDYRVDLHISGIGPNTKDLPLGTTLPQNANQLLLGVLDGVAPAGSKQLKVSGGGIVT